MAETAGITETFTEVEFKPGVHLQIGTNKEWWRVLDVDREQETALLIADTPVAEKPYHEEVESTTWEKCTLRAWLNGEFYEKYFSKEEKAAIIETELENPNNPQCGTLEGNTTTNRFFLLSITEAMEYFKDDNYRANGSRWWLRSPGNNNRNAAYVNYDGVINKFGYIVFGSFGVGACPACKINLKSDFFRSFIISQSSESIIIKVPELSIQDGCVNKASPNVTAIKIPNGVTAIGRYAFSNCKDLPKWKDFEEKKPKEGPVFCVIWNISKKASRRVKLFRFRDTGRPCILKCMMVEESALIPTRTTQSLSLSTRFPSGL